MNKTETKKIVVVEAGYGRKSLRIKCPNCNASGATIIYPESIKEDVLTSCEECDYKGMVHGISVEVDEPIRIKEVPEKSISIEEMLHNLEHRIKHLERELRFARFDRDTAYDVSSTTTC